MRTKPLTILALPCPVAAVLATTAVAAREFRVVIRLDQLDPALRPGLTCTAEILTREKRDVLTVPLQAAVLRPDPAGAGDLIVDEQRFGPYRIWHHQHHFDAVKGGVEMADRVYYSTKFGPRRGQ